MYPSYQNNNENSLNNRQTFYPLNGLNNLNNPGQNKSFSYNANNNTQKPSQTQYQGFYPTSNTYGDNDKKINIKTKFNIKVFLFGCCFGAVILLSFMLCSAISFFAGYVFRIRLEGKEINVENIFSKYYETSDNVDKNLDDDERMNSSIKDIFRFGNNLPNNEDQSDDKKNKSVSSKDNNSGNINDVGEVISQPNIYDILKSMQNAKSYNISMTFKSPSEVIYVECKYVYPDRDYAKVDFEYELFEEIAIGENYYYRIDNGNWDLIEFQTISAFREEILNALKSEYLYEAKGEENGYWVYDLKGIEEMYGSGKLYVYKGSNYISKLSFWMKEDDDLITYEIEYSNFDSGGISIEVPI